MPNFKRIGGGPWKNGQKSVDLIWNDPDVVFPAGQLPQSEVLMDSLWGSVVDTVLRLCCLFVPG